LPENSLDGIERALSFGFRPDAQKVIIVVTDEPSQQKGDGKSNSAYTMDDVKSDLFNSSVMLIAVSPDFRNRNDNPGFPLSNLPKYADMRELGNEASGLWIDINSADFSTILKQIQGILTGIYVIEYTSPDLTPSMNRTVFVSVDAPGCLKGSASGFYTTPGSAPESQGALSISGRIFDDSNGDGVKGTDEAGLEGWDVLLERPDGNSSTVKTDRKGYYIFTGLQPGSYGLGAVAQGNWTITAPAEGIQAVELVDTHESEIDFGFRLPLANQPPLITVLMAEPESPQEVGASITWTADASDPDGDQILYRFFLSDEPMTDWIPENSWTWTPNEVGSYQVEVRVRDGKHAGSNGMDDQRISEGFEITRLNALPAINNLVPAPDGETAITWTAEAEDPENDPILYRFLLNSKSVTDWTTSNKWTLNINEADVGNNEIEAQIRDGEHEGPDGYDDAKSIQITLTSMKLIIQKKWAKTFGGLKGDIGYSVQQTNDGGYIIAGTTDSDYAGEIDALLIKTDSQGNKEWEKTFGGSKEDSVRSVQQTIDGGYIVAGYTMPYSTILKDAWLIKTDSLGNKEWDKTFGGNDDEMANSVRQTNDGGYIIAGTTHSYGAGNGDAWLIKTDSSGNMLWDRTFDVLSTEYANSVQLTSDNGYIIAGLDTNQGLLLIKTDAQGNKQWDRTFDISTELLDWTMDVWPEVQQTSDGGYIIAASKPESITVDRVYSSAWLIKTDSSGNKEWDRTFGVTVDRANSVQQTSDGGYIIAGYTNSYGSGMCDIWLIKTDSSGNKEWDRTFGGSENDQAYSVRQTSDGGYIIVGSTRSEGAGEEDIWLIKTDANGNV
jgi:hypothetical protein